MPQLNQLPGATALADSDVLATQRADSTTQKLTGLHLKQSAAYLGYSAAPAIGRWYDLVAKNSNLVRIQSIFSDAVYLYIVSHTTGYILRLPLDDPGSAGTGLDMSFIPNFLPIGGVCDGRYLYLPNHSSAGANMLARVDLTNFTAGGVTTLDMKQLDPALVETSVGACYDGRYVYVAVAGATIPTGGVTQYLVRFDTLDFSLGSALFIPIANTPAPGVALISGVCCDGNYVYAMIGSFPNASSITPPSNLYISRVACSNFTHLDNTVVDAAYSSVNMPAICFDGRYLLLTPSGPDAIPLRRFDTLNWPAVDSFAFTEPTFDLFSNTRIPIWHRYAYMILARNSKVLVVDLVNFGSYAVIDLANTDPTPLQGYSAGVIAGGALWIATQAPGFGRLIRLQLEDVG